MPSSGFSFDEPLGELIARVYPTLQRMAAARARGSGLAPSSIVQDTLVRVLKLREPPRSEGHLEAVSWRLMEWVVLDRVRSDDARKRRESEAAVPQGSDGDPRLEALCAAMKELAELDPRKAETLTLTLACGVSMERTAELLGVSTKTVQRDVEFGRAWLAARLQDMPSAHDPASPPQDGRHARRRS